MFPTLVLCMIPPLLVKLKPDIEDWGGETGVGLTCCLGALAGFFVVFFFDGAFGANGASALYSSSSSTGTTFLLVFGLAALFVLEPCPEVPSSFSLPVISWSELVRLGFLAPLVPFGLGCPTTSSSRGLRAVYSRVSYHLLNQIGYESSLTFFLPWCFSTRSSSELSTGLFCSSILALFQTGAELLRWIYLSLLASRTIGRGRFPSNGRFLSGILDRRTDLSWFLFGIFIVIVRRSTLKNIQQNLFDVDIIGFVLIIR